MDGQIRKIIALHLIVGLALSGCAQYKKPPLTVKVPDFYPHKTQLNKMTIVADPYFEKSKMTYIFNNDLLEKGFLAIHFIAFNFGEESYDLSKSEFVLERDDNFELRPLNPDQVAKRVFKHTPLRMIGWGFAGLIILSIPFSLAAGADSYRSNKATRKALKDEVLKVFEVNEKEAVSGFYFFELGRRKREIREALQRQYQFKIRGIVNKNTEKSYDLAIGLN